MNHLKGLCTAIKSECNKISDRTANIKLLSIDGALKSMLYSHQNMLPLPSPTEIGPPCNAVLWNSFFVFLFNWKAEKSVCYLCFDLHLSNCRLFISQERKMKHWREIQASMTACHIIREDMWHLRCNVVTEVKTWLQGICWSSREANRGKDILLFCLVLLKCFC